MFFKKLSAVLLATISVAIGLLIGNQLITIIYYKIIGGGFIGYHNTASDTLYFFQVLLGIFLLIIFVIGLFVFVVFVYRYLYHGVPEGKLLRRFCLIFSIIMYTLPASLLLYLFAFSGSITLLTISMIVVCIVLASVSLKTYKNYK
ncbi:MAG: hypothetical protein ACLFPF_06200 [Halanaerobiales bacterium]